MLQGVFMKKSIQWEKYKTPADVLAEKEAAQVEEEEYNEDSGNDEGFILNSVVNPLATYIPPEKHFNFYLGHTNFDIEEGCPDVIEKIEGVEALKIITRYRFVVGIGKNLAFNPSLIQLEIANSLGALSVQKDENED